MKLMGLALTLVSIEFSLKRIPCHLDKLKEDLKPHMIEAYKKSNHEIV